MSTYDLLIAPFADYGFMRRALVACLCLALGSGPIGVFLMLRRMSLMGDAMSHAVLPGAAIGYLVAGSLSLTAMGIGGLVAGLSVALLSGIVSRATVLQGGCKLRKLLPDLTGPGRADRLAARFQHRSAARAVRHHSCHRRRGTRTHRLDHVGDARCPCPRLPAAGGGMFRSGLSAHRRRPRAGLSRAFPAARGAEHGRKLPGARHADGGRADDAAGGGGAALGPQPDRDDNSCRRHGRDLRLCRAGRLLSPRTRLRPDDHHDGSGDLRLFHPLRTVRPCPAALPRPHLAG